MMSRGADAIQTFISNEMGEQQRQELPARSAALPAFPVSVLPESCARFVTALAEAQQAPLDMAVGFLLGVASSAVVGRVEIRPNMRQPSYTEPAQLFVLVQGESSERKSSTLKLLEQPLHEHLARLRAKIREKNAATERELEAVEAEIRRKVAYEEGIRLREQRDALRERLVREPEVIKGEASVEAIAASMAEHDGRFILLGGEGQFLNTLTGRSYSRAGNAVNLDAVLEGYGNGRVSGARIRDKADWDIPRASLALCLGVQPGLLKDFMGDRVSRERGLHGRFLFFLPQSRIGARSVCPEPVPPALMDWWVRLIDYLAAIGRLEPLTITFTREAEEGYFRFAERIEPRLVGDLGGDMQPWGGKLVGNTVRLAGLLALMDRQVTVYQQHWEAAQTIAEAYLIPHARRAFLGEDPRLGEAARKLLGMIRGMERFDESILWQRQARYTIESKAEYEEGLQHLHETRYIQRAEIQKEWGGKGRKPATTWQVLHAEG